jgi:hypothetical protein
MKSQTASHPMNNLYASQFVSNSWFSADRQSLHILRSVVIALLALFSAIAPASAQNGSTNAQRFTAGVEPPPYTLDSRNSRASAEDFARLTAIATRHGIVWATNPLF